VLNAAGIVLCGGRSTRMGSPKALLPFGNETMVERVVRLLGEAVSPIVVVAAAGQPLPPLPAASITHDARDNRGPLEGLRAGLSALPQDVDAAYATAVDVPFLIPAFVSRMVELLGNDDVAVMEVDGFTHPLSAVYQPRVLPDVEALLDAGRLRMADLFDVVNTRRVRAEEMAAVDPGLATLRNINTPEDYRRALEQAVNRQ
jgi:molybdenum cofactor guanylyltransferase